MVIIALCPCHVTEEVVKASESGEITLVAVSKVPPIEQQPVVRRSAVGIHERCPRTVIETVRTSRSPLSCILPREAEPASMFLVTAVHTGLHKMCK